MKIHVLANFDILTMKIAYGNLCEPYQGVIIITPFDLHTELQNLKEEGGERQKFEVKRAF